MVRLLSAFSILLVAVILAPQTWQAIQGNQNAAQPGCVVTSIDGSEVERTIALNSEADWSGTTYELAEGTCGAENVGGITLYLPLSGAEAAGVASVSGIYNYGVWDPDGALDTGNFQPVIVAALTGMPLLATLLVGVVAWGR